MIRTFLRTFFSRQKVITKASLQMRLQNLKVRTFHSNLIITTLFSCIYPSTSDDLHDDSSKIDKIEGWGLFKLIANRAVSTCRINHSTYQQKIVKSSFQRQQKSNLFRCSSTMVPIKGLSMISHHKEEGVLVQTTRR